MCSALLVVVARKSQRLQFECSNIAVRDVLMSEEMKGDRTRGGRLGSCGGGGLRQQAERGSMGGWE